MSTVRNYSRLVQVCSDAKMSASIDSNARRSHSSAGSRRDASERVGAHGGYADQLLSKSKGLC